MKLTYKQDLGLKIVLDRYKHKEKYAVISGYAGSGKAQPNDTVIPTPEGNRLLGDLKVGDYVYNRLGQPTKVIGVYPQGQLEVFKITLADGRSTLCNDEHIWTYYTSKGNLYSKTAKEMLDSGLKNNGRGTYKFKIPTHKAIEYPEQEYEIHPYVIGAFLGNGCCKEKLLSLSSENNEIPEIIAKYTDFNYKRNSENNYTWHFCYKEAIQSPVNTEYIRTSPHTEDFFCNFKDNLCVEAYNKSIPEIYKKGSIEQRYALMRGLMDTDGSISSKDGHRYNMRFTTTSLTLANDVREILYSLGYSNITISKDNREDKYTTGVCYNLLINIPNEEKYKFFELDRKYQIALEAKKYYKYKDYNKIAITSIEDLDYVTEMTCIMVDNDEHLYLTNDYIVTHNTTLVKFIAEALSSCGVDLDEDIAYSAYTGKAVNVLKSKGNLPALTCHRLLWEFFPKKDGGFTRKRITILPYKVVVVDECSMIDEDILAELFSHKETFFIFVGDIAQLPPVSQEKAKGTTGYDLLQNPHVFLDEIMRQAQESEIIRLSMDIREGKPLKTYEGNEVMILPKDSLNEGMLTWADQILCATNDTRTELNNTLRNILGRGPEPEPEDRVICCRNYWDICSKEEDALVNGTIGKLRQPVNRDVYLPFKLGGNTIHRIVSTIDTDEGDSFYNIALDPIELKTGKPQINDWKKEYSINRYYKTKWAIEHGLTNPLPQSFAYGYAITTWKAQGSEYNKVLVIEEQYPWDKVNHKKYLYTAATRSKDKLVIIMK